MHHLFLILLIGGTLLVTLQLVVKAFLDSLNLWNLAVATANQASWGIVNLSGRSNPRHPTIMLQDLPSPAPHQHLSCPAYSLGGE